MSSPSPARRLPGTARRDYFALRHRDPRTLTSSGLLVVLVAALAAFGHLVEDYLTGDPIVRWDVQFARWLHEHSSGWLVQLFKVVTLAGNTAVLGVIVVAIGFVFLRRGRANDAAVLFLAFGGASVVNSLLKLVFHRPRPELAFVHLDTYSFPSGHAATSSATFTVMAYLLARAGITRPGLGSGSVSVRRQRLLSSGSPASTSARTTSPTCSRGSASGWRGPRPRSSPTRSGASAS